MYTPRVAKTLPHHEIIVVAGDPLDLSTIERVRTDGKRTDARSGFVVDGAARGGWMPEFKTLGLRQFLKTYADQFDAAAFMEHYEPDGVRSTIDGGYEFRCPNADGHTNGDQENDRAFMVKNGLENTHGSGFHMGCLHDSCKTASGGDRAWYLDLFCQRHDVIEVKALEEFCPNKTAEDGQQAEDTNAREASITTKVAVLKQDTDIGQLREIYHSSPSADRWTPRPRE